jgi:hypothetical protein
VSKVFTVGRCPGNGIDGNYSNPGYIYGGDIESEKDLLSENNILNDVIYKVPDYNDT